MDTTDKTPPPLTRAVLAAAQLPMHAQVLDIACGAGRFSGYLADTITGTGRIVGIDLNPKRIKQARANSTPSQHSIEWLAADAADLPFKTGVFDAAFILQGLQFFPEPSRALREIRRVLAPGAPLVLTCWNKITPLFAAIAESLGARLGSAAAKRALQPFSLGDGGEIHALLQGAGFSDITCVELGFDLFVPSIRDRLFMSPNARELHTAGEDTIQAIVKDVQAALIDDRHKTGYLTRQETYLLTGNTPG